MEHSGLELKNFMPHHHSGCFVDQSAIKYLLETLQQDIRSVCRMSLRVEICANVLPHLRSEADEHLVIFIDVWITAVGGIMCPVQFLLREVLTRRCAWY